MFLDVSVPSTPLGSSMGRFVRFLAHVVCSGLVTSIGHGWMFSCSSSPELQLLSPPFEIWKDLIGDSSRFVGGALVLGVGGALFLGDSAVFSGMSFSRVRRCSRSRVSSCSCVFLFAMRFLFAPQNSTAHVQFFLRSFYRFSHVSHSVSLVLHFSMFPLFLCFFVLVEVVL